MKSIALTPSLAQLAHTGAKTLTCRPGDTPAPYAVGDVCYIRETWQMQEEIGHGIWEVFRGRSRDLPDLASLSPQARMEWQLYYLGAAPHIRGPWRPSIHMPAWAARTVVRVTEVELVALDDLTEADAMAGGVVCTPLLAAPVYCLAGTDAYWSTATLAYGHALQAIYTPARVATVWRIRFERVTP